MYKRQLKYQNLYERFSLKPSKGVLLQGPPGTGKTLIAKALATEAGVNFISVRGPQILNQYIGESEKAIRNIFLKARLAAPTILFFDEIDAIASARGSVDSDALERVVAQFLTELDGAQELNGVFMLAATNRVDRIDPALLRPGRFDAVMEVPAPNKDVRRAILEIHTKDIPIASDLDLLMIAEQAEGLVGADLAGVVRIASQTALRRAIVMGEANGDVTSDDFANALILSHQNAAIRHHTP